MLSTILLLMLSAAGAQADLPSVPQKHVIPISIDEPAGNEPAWKALAGIAGSARVIGFAEAAHMQPEYLQLRNAFFEYLVQSGGVTAIAVETSFLKSLEVDVYVQGQGPVQPSDETIHSVFSWAPHVAVENRQLIEWMRAYNTRPATKRPVKFYGIDLTGVRPGEDLYQQARAAADGALAYVARLDPATARVLADRLGPALGHFTKSGYARLSLQQRDALTAALVDLENLFGQRRAEWLSKTPPLEYRRALRKAILARQHDADFRADPDGRWQGSAREVAMADNVQWVLDQEGPQGRILLFASGNHLTRGPNEEYRNEQLGAQLDRLLGKDYAVIGSYWGGDAASVNAPLRAVAERASAPNFLLDLRGGGSSSFDAMLFLRPRAQAYAW